MLESPTAAQILERCGRALWGLGRLQVSLVGDLLEERHVTPVVVPFGFLAADQVRETEEGDGPASVEALRAPRVEPWKGRQQMVPPPALHQLIAPVGQLADGEATEVGRPPAMMFTRRGEGGRACEDVRQLLPSVGSEGQMEVVVHRAAIDAVEADGVPPITRQGRPSRRSSA